jgi:hypothetical protein
MTFARFLLLGLVAPTAVLADDPRPILVGVAKVDITPAEPILMNGYLARGTIPSKGTAQAIKAVALAIGSDEQGASLLVTVDSLGIPDAMTGDLAARLGRRAGIARERLAVGASHTHSAPCLPGVAPNIFGKPIPADQQAAIDRYATALLDKLERLCLDALADRSPALLAWGQGSVDFAINRRTKGGPVDHALPMLRAVGLDGKLRAVLVNYACHCTTLAPMDYLVSGDWAADAREAIEADHPGSTALVLIGCSADSNPKDRPGREVARRHGRAIGDEVARLLKGPLLPIGTSPVGRLVRIKLPFDALPTVDELRALVAKGGPAGYNASTQLARLDRGEPLQAELDYVVQAWHFGDDLAIVFLAGEVVVDYALRLKAELDPNRLWVVAYANDDPCYIPSERILREGGYEGGGAMVYYGRPTRLKPGVEGKIIAAVRGLIPPGFEAPKAADRSSPADSFGGLEVLGVELADGPEQPSGDEVLVTGVVDRPVVVAQRGGEDLRPAVIHVGPDDHGFGGDLPAGCRPVFLAVLPRERLVSLLAFRERVGGRLELARGVVVEFFLDRGPVGERIGDRVVLVDEGDGDRLLGPVPGGDQAEELHPGGRDVLVPALGPEAVHPAVQDDGGQALLVRLEHGLDDLHRVDVGGALVVDDDVEVLGPVGLVIDGVLVLGGAVGVVGDRPLDVGLAGDSLGEDVFLALVVVAAPAEDQEGADRLDRLIRAARQPHDRRRTQDREQPPGLSGHRPTLPFASIDRVDCPPRRSRGVA